MSGKLPRTARRLFAHYEEVESLPTVAPELVMAKLLEEGDAMDLRWLTRTYSPSRLCSWLEHHGDRLLTRRSLSFWNMVLDQPQPSTEGAENQLWPL